jgi:hypothetical protein
MFHVVIFFNTVFFILKILKSLWSNSPAGYYTLTSTEELGLPPTWIVRMEFLTPSSP